MVGRSLLAMIAQNLLWADCEHAVHSHPAAVAPEVHRLQGPPCCLWLLCGSFHAKHFTSAAQISIHSQLHTMEGFGPASTKAAHLQRPLPHRWRSAGSAGPCRLHEENTASVAGLRGKWWQTAQEQAWRTLYAPTKKPEA